LMWPQTAAAPVPFPLQTGCSVLNGALLLQLLQTSDQNGFLSLLYIVVVQQNDVLHVHVVHVEQHIFHALASGDDQSTSEHCSGNQP
jgi:hypothetical protein